MISILYMSGGLVQGLGRDHNRTITNWNDVPTKKGNHWSGQCVKSPRIWLRNVVDTSLF